MTNGMSHETTPSSAGRGLSSTHGLSRAVPANAYVTPTTNRTGHSSFTTVSPTDARRGPGYSTGYQYPVQPPVYQTGLPYHPCTYNPALGYRSVYPNFVGPSPYGPGHGMHVPGMHDRNMRAHGMPDRSMHDHGMLDRNMPDYNMADSHNMGHDIAGSRNIGHGMPAMPTNEYAQLPGFLPNSRTEPTDALSGMDMLREPGRAPRATFNPYDTFTNSRPSDPSSQYTAQLNAIIQSGRIDPTDIGLVINTLQQAESIMPGAMDTLVDKVSARLNLNDTTSAPRTPRQEILENLARTTPPSPKSPDDFRRSFDEKNAESRILIQVGEDGQEYDNHGSTYMDPVAYLEATHIAINYAMRFGTIVASRMFVLPVRSGRNVIMIEVIFKTKAQAQNAFATNRLHSAHGVTSDYIRARLLDGSRPTNIYRIWASEYDELIFDPHRSTIVGSSVEDDAAGLFVFGMQRRWLGNYNGEFTGKLDISMLREQAEAVINTGFANKVGLNLPRGSVRRRSGRNDDSYGLYCLDILVGRDIRTTIMYKNIPNSVTAEQLITFLQWSCPGLFDYVYLRMDFTYGCNVGYAFINFVDASHIVAFAHALNFKRWPGSDKRAEISYAAFQGRDTLINRFRNSAVMDAGWGACPHLFYAAGHPLCGREEAFPASNNEMKKRNSHKNVSTGLFTKDGGRRSNGSSPSGSRRWS